MFSAVYARMASAYILPCAMVIWEVDGGLSGDTGLKVGGEPKGVTSKPDNREIISSMRSILVVRVQRYEVQETCVS